MGLFDWIRGTKRRADRERDARMEGTLERVVNLTNPRLRFARRYRARLTPAVETALDYAHTLVAGVPPPRDATPEGWQSDCCIRAFFATADDLSRVFSRSPEVRTWFEGNPGAAEICAVLSMRLMETRILGIALEGGMLRRDVPQTTLSFDDHRVRICGRSEADLREEIERRIVDQLAITGLAAATQAKARRDVLEQEHALLRARLRLLQGRGDGLAVLMGKDATDGSQLARLHAELAMNEANLRSIASGAEALDYQLECVRNVLEHPADHLFVTGRRVRVDRMNVELDEASPTPGEMLDLQIARIPIPDGAPEFRTFALTRFPRAALLPRSALVQEAARMLH